MYGYKKGVGQNIDAGKVEVMKNTKSLTLNIIIL